MLVLFRQVQGSLDQAAKVITTRVTVSEARLLFYMSSGFTPYIAVRGWPLSIPPSTLPAMCFRKDEHTLPGVHNLGMEQNKTHEVVWVLMFELAYERRGMRSDYHPRDVGRQDNYLLYSPVNTCLDLALILSMTNQHKTRVSAWPT